MNGDTSSFSLVFDVQSPTSILVVRFNNLNATAGFVRRTVSPHNVDYIHLLIRGDTSGEVEKVEHDAHIVPGLSSRCLLKVDSGFTHGERVLTL